MSCYGSYAVRKDIFVSSFLKNINDPLLSYGSMDVCTQFYFKGGEDRDNDAYISPNVADDELIRKMPPSRFFISKEDPLADD